MNTTDEWKEEIREYFDITLKAKKPTMKNLERELLVNYFGNLLTSQRTKDRAELREKIQTFKLLEVGVNTEGYLSKVRYNQALDRVLELLKD